MSGAQFLARNALIAWIDFQAPRSHFIDDDRAEAQGVITASAQMFGADGLARARHADQRQRSGAFICFRHPSSPQH